MPEIQRFVNAAFGEEMVKNEPTLQAAYVPLSPGRMGDESQPAIVALPVPEPHARSASAARRRPAKAIDESLPDAIGGFIAWLATRRRAAVAEWQADGADPAASCRDPVPAVHQLP